MRIATAMIWVSLATGCATPAGGGQARAVVNPTAEAKGAEDLERHPDQLPQEAMVWPRHAAHRLARTVMEEMPLWRKRIAYVEEWLDLHKQQCLRRDARDSRACVEGVHEFPLIEAGLKRLAAELPALVGAIEGSPDELPVDLSQRVLKYEYVLHATDMRLLLLTCCSSD